MLELQRFILEKNPTRRELIQYVPQSKNVVRIGVYRNHSFELIEHTIAPYLDFSGIRAEFLYSDYDDSLSFINLDTSIDMLIIWLDLSRYKIDNISSFINDRLESLRNFFTKPILFISFEGEIKISNDSIVKFCLEDIKKELADSYLDLRMEAYTGTKLSAKANIRISKELGLKYIPATLKSPLKAIVVDLDNTLYKGVLGEDGIKGIQLTEGHKKLQEQLKKLAEKGFFLCVASKNDDRDVRDMFKARKDFPLKESDFSIISASWDEKANSISEMLRILNIGVDSVLFIDDNIGELTSVLFAFPQIRVLHAKDDAEITSEMLSFYPGLLKLRTQSEDKIRSADTKANIEREKIRGQMSKEDYIKSLKMKLTFDFNNYSMTNRVFELANKTNQFIFNYKRYSYAEVERLMQEKDSLVLTVSLSDKLSDSGIIGVCVALNKKECVEIEEFFVSCRALGRGIDNIIVLGAINEAVKYFNSEKLKVIFKKGERNVPAEMFVKEHLNNYTIKADSFSYDFPEGLISIEKKGEKESKHEKNN